MKISDFINKEFTKPDLLNQVYIQNEPYPHIVMDNFIKEDLLLKVLDEFPDLSKLDAKVEFKKEREIKYASIGFKDIQKKALELITFLNSDIFLTYLQKVLHFFLVKLIEKQRHQFCLLNYLYFYPQQ